MSKLASEQILVLHQDHIKSAVDRPGAGLVLCNSTSSVGNVFPLTLAHHYQRAWLLYMLNLICTEMRACNGANTS